MGSGELHEVFIFEGNYNDALTIAQQNNLEHHLGPAVANAKYVYFQCSCGDINSPNHNKLKGLYAFGMSLLPHS